MVKRRRLDSGNEYGVPEDWDQSQQQFPPSRSLSNTGPAFGNASANPDYASNARAHDASTAGNAGVATGAADSSAGAWQGSTSASTAASGSRSYPPNLSSYPTQPYYSLQPADLSTYNSPWPPTAAPSFGNQSAASYPIPAPRPGPAPAMPYFPSNSAAETSEHTYITDTPLPVSSYTRDLEPSSTQYAHSQGPNGQGGTPSQQPSAQRSNDTGTSSSLYIDDASMHLKIQSLSILENLVSRTPRRLN